MNTQTPKHVDVEIGEAFQLAIHEQAPIFVPTGLYADDRGWSAMNLLRGVMSSEGQINYTVMYPQVVKAWHRHEKQTDFWLCVQGHIKAGVWRESDDQAWMIVMGEKRPGILVIPPGLWHGASTVGPESAGMLYYVTHGYDPESPDEERRAFDSVRGFSWGIEHR